MNIVRIDYTNPLHLECIWKLSKNNDFHKDDIRGLLYGESSLGIEKLEKNGNKLSEYIKTELKKGYQRAMNDILTEYNGRKEYYGLFVCNNKKPIGYILYYLRKNDMEVDITFILVDKKHQNKGYGTMLINKLKEIVSNKKPIIYVRIDNNKLEKYYNKLGFYGLDILASQAFIVAHKKGFGKVLTKWVRSQDSPIPQDIPAQMLLIVTENERNPTTEKKLACGVF